MQKTDNTLSASPTRTSRASPSPLKLEDPQVPSNHTTNSLNPTSPDTRPTKRAKPDHEPSSTHPSTSNTLPLTPTAIKGASSPLIQPDIPGDGRDSRPHMIDRWLAGQENNGESFNSDSGLEESSDEEDYSSRPPEI